MTSKIKEKLTVNKKNISNKTNKIKIYKEANKSETETTINILYGEKILSIYTNKINLQRKLCKILGEPKKEYIKGKSITGSTWDVSLDDKSKITKIMLRANIFEV